MTEDTLTFVLHEEGGYVNDPNDRGGATNFGVTQATYDLFRKQWKEPVQPVRHIDPSEVRRIYEDFYVSAHSDALPIGLDTIHFDFAINAGSKQAVRTLQRVLGVEPADGIFGPQTRKALNGINVEDTIRSYANARRDFYNYLVIKRPANSSFLKGWLKRTDRCEKRALEAYRASGADSGSGGVPSSDHPDSPA